MSCVLRECIASRKADMLPMQCGDAPDLGTHNKCLTLVNETKLEAVVEALHFILLHAFILV